MMGSEYGEEDERRIARVENIHYTDSNVAGNGNGGNRILMNSVSNAMGPVRDGVRRRSQLDNLVSCFSRNLPSPDSVSPLRNVLKYAAQHAFVNGGDDNY